MIKKRKKKKITIRVARATELKVELIRPNRRSCKKGYLTDQSIVTATSDQEVMLRLVCALSPHGRLGACRCMLSVTVRVHIVTQSITDVFFRIAAICYCWAARIDTTHIS